MNNLKHVSFRIDERLWHDLAMLAIELRSSRQKLMESAIMDYIRKVREESNDVA